MQGYTWSSNQLPPPNYQEHVSRYQERPPTQYQERLPPLYQERPPLHYQEQFPPKYQDVRNEQSNMFQGQYNTQFYTTSQTRYSNGQQDADFQQNFNGYNTQTNQAHPQYLYAASNTQQHYPTENSYTNGYYAQFNTQSNVSSPQNYRNTGHNQANMYWSPQSDHGSSVGNDRGWKFHMYNNGSSCSVNNQQLQPVRTAPHRCHQQQQQQQQFSRRHSGKHHKHHWTQGRHPKSTSRDYKKGVSKNKAQSQTATSNTSCNSTTPPSGAQSDTSMPSNNVNQSPVNQNQPELRSNAGPDVSTTQSQNNQSTEQQSQHGNSGTYNVNETSQITQMNEAQPNFHNRFVKSLIYRLLCTKDNERADTQQSDERIAHHNTGSEQSEVCATNRTDHHSKEPFSEPSAQCTAEPPSKRFKCAVVQRDYWNKDRSDFGVQSVRPGTHQTGGNENRPKGLSQHIIQYSTDPADCLEAVFALQKVSQQVHKAIAIVPPISQQTSNTAQMDDTSPRKADSPPLKIDSVWSLEESDAQKIAEDKLPKSPLPTAQQEEKSLEIETTSNIAYSDICSTIPTSTDICSTNPALLVERQNNVQSGDCDSSNASFDLSSVPVVKYTLGNLMDSVKSLELMELSSGCPEKYESPVNTILQLFWNGNQVYLVEKLLLFRKELSELSSVEIVWDHESVVFESIEPENLKKLAHCIVLNNEMYSSSEEFRSSWLNVDGQPADIEKVLSEPVLDDITVIEAPSQLLSNNTVVTPANLGVNALKDLPVVSSAEKDVNPDMGCPTALFTPQSGNDGEEMNAENYRHSYAGLSRIKFLSSISSEKVAIKKQEDIKQNHNFNTQPSDNSTLAERSTEKLTGCSNKMEVSRQDHSEQTRHNASVSDMLPLSPGDNVLDGVKNSEVSFSTETLCISKDTWQIEDISDDETPGNKEALNNSSDIGLVEDISDDETSKNKEVLPNPSDIWLVEDISDNENTGNKEVLPYSSDIWQVEDISDDENPSNKDTCSSNSDICVVEDVSNDENSSDDTLSMEITVLSSEDAKTFFQELEDEPECGIKTTTSIFDCPDRVACFDVPNQPNYDICSLCGSKIKISNSTNVTDSDADLFCPQCWEQAPLLELEEEPCSPMTNEADVLGSPAKSNKQGLHCSSPCVQLEVNEPAVASKKEYIVDERLTGQDTKSEHRQILPSLELNVKELSVASPETCVVDKGLTGQKRDSMIKSELGENCCPPCVDLKVKEPAVALLKESIGNEKLTGQKCHGMVKSDLGQIHSPPPLDLKVKELTVTSTKKCIVDEGLTGQKSKSLLKSELRENFSSPSLELQVKVPNVAPPEECIADEGLTEQKSDSIVKSELRQNCGRPSLELKVDEPTVASTKKCIDDEGLKRQKSKSLFKSEPRQNCSSASLQSQVNVSNVASPEKCIADEGLTGQKSDSMVKSELRQNCGRPSLELKVDEPTVASTKKCIDDEGLKRQKSKNLFKSEPRQFCSPPSLELQVKVPDVAPPEKCIADEGLTGQKSESLFKSEPRQYCSPPSLELQVKVPDVAPPEEYTENERLTGPKSDCMVKSELRQNCGRPSLELKVDEPTVASTKKCIDDEGLKGQKSKSFFKSELRQNCGQPSLELKADEPTVASTEKCSDDEELKGQKSKSLFKSELRQNCSSASLQSQVKVSNVASPEKCIADEGLTGQISDSMVKSVTQKVPEIQRPAGQEIKQKNDLTETNKLDKPHPLLQCNKPPSKKSAFLKHKLKSGSTSTDSDDSVLFTPDIVVKKNLPQKKNLPKKRPSGESQECRKVKKLKEHRQAQDYPDRTSPHHRENPQKVTEKVLGHSNDTSPSKKFELHGILSLKKPKTEPKKVRFDLYGSNREKQIYAQERRFSAPATLTVSDTCNDYSDVLSAKQKVHHQWSSTFIPKTKRSPQERVPQNKKPQKTKDALESSMSALKSHMAQRAKLLSSSKRETNHFRKPVFHQKLTKTLSG